MKKARTSAHSQKRPRSPRRAMNRLSLFLLMLALCAVALAAGPFLTHKVQSAVASAPARPDDVRGQTLSPAAAQQIQALVLEKQSRTPEQQKIDSQLLHALKARRGELPSSLQALASAVATDAQGKTTVDITADASDAFLDRLRQSGALIVVSVPESRSVRAVLPLDQLEAVASLPEVTFIQPRQEAINNEMTLAHPGRRARAASDPGFERRAANVRTKLNEALQDLNSGGGGGGLNAVGSVATEGDRTHRADEARSTFHVDGTGIKIGVLSDGADGRETAIASGDLPPVTILPGQAGFGSKGTAIMEIIHDLAPGAQLYFATSANGIASFAQNIRDLNTVGCQIIVDDTNYFKESPFQDGQSPSVTSTSNGGLVTQAVIDVTTSGVIYFASAGDDGNKDDGTSGTWEGDFTDGGTIPNITGRVHDFDTTVGVSQYNVITAVPTPATPIDLFWSDPLGGASDDYDLFVLDSTGTNVVAASTNFQNGTQDPVEEVPASANAVNNRIVVVKFAGANRFLHLATNRGTTQFSTPGTIKGHGMAALAYSVGATPAVGPYPNPFNSSNISETFSADGPRRIFFNSDSTAITPGNFSSSGGTLRQKPDITAADGVSVTGAGNSSSPFYGTSAGAAHAAAIAALMKQAVPGANQSQIRAAIVNSAVDIEAPGIDRDTGAGIIMAFGSLQALGATGTAALQVGTVTAAETSGNGNGFVEPGESGALSVQLVNTGVQTATGISATLSTSTPGIVITQPNSTYSNLPPSGGSANNSTPFAFTVDPSVPCNTVVNFTLTVTYTGGTSPVTLNFTLQLGESISLSTVIDSALPPTGTLFTSTTGIQLGAVARTGVASSCASAKAFPGLLGPAPGVIDSSSRGFDAYTLKNTSGSTICVTIDVRTPSATNAVQSITYLGNYDYRNKDQNYLGDSGTTPDPKPYSVLVPANSTFVVVVNEVNPGSGAGNPYTLNITGLPCGSSSATLAPTNNVPGAQSINEDTNLTFSSGNGNQISVTDPNGASHQLPVSLSISSGFLTIPDRTGLTFSVGSGQAEQGMTFTGTPANVNNALNGLLYQPTGNFNGPVTLTIRTGIDATDTDTVTINVQAVNDTPDNLIPGPQTVTENGTLTFSGASRISIADVDAGSNPLQETLTATNGTISLSGIAGLSFTDGDGTADVTMTFTGTLTDINAALDNLTFTPTPGYSGSASLQIITNDQGNTGSGGAKTRTNTISITVTEGGAFQFNSATYSVGEGGGTATITVTRAGGSAGAASVNYATSDGTAIVGSDYTAASGTLNFANGETSKTFDVPILNDALDEADETVNLTLSNAGGAGALGSPLTATLTIQDDDAAPTLSISDVSVTEGNSGTTNATFTVTLSAISGQTVKADFATADGSAAAGSDYQSASGTVTFNPGQTSQTITVLINGDIVSEPDETFAVNLTNPQNATFAKSSGTGTIQNDDATPTLSINDVNVTEGNSGTTNAVFAVTLSGPSSQTVSASFATTNGTASSGSDYQSASGTVTFNPGEISKTVTVNVNGDTVIEPDETFFVDLSNPVNTSFSDSHGVGTITNDDGAATISVNDVSVLEGNTGTTNAVFTVSLSAASSQTISTDFATSDATASAGSDYQSASGTVVFNPGETSKTIMVLVNGDNVSESNETFTINLTNPHNASFAKASGIGTIVDDDGTPGLSVNDVGVSEGNSGTASAVFTVTLSQPNAATVKVDFATADGTATAGSDYQSTSGTLTFNPGETTKTVTVTVNGDTINEPAEVFFVNLSNPVNAGISDAQGTGMILNDDGPAVQFNASTYAVAEDSLHVVVTVTRTGDTSAASTVGYATSDSAGLAPCNVSGGIASQRCDYATVVGTVSFAAGETSKTVFIPIVDDGYVEGDESFSIMLSNPTGATLGAASSATVTILSNDAGGAANPIATNAFFVRQHYIDFLGREPDPPGFQGWLNILANCGTTVQQPCDRVEVSSDFYRSDEFQTRGYFIYRFYRAALGRNPSYAEFIPDLARVSGFLNTQELEAARVSFVADFMNRAEFKTKYDPSLNDPAAYVSLLEQTAGVTLSNRQQLITGLQNSTETRATVLRKVIESTEVATKFFNEAFVVEAYFGYLRRDPDAAFQTWVQLLNQTGDRRALVGGFVNSNEYVQRFGP